MLELFGPAAHDAVMPMLDALGVELVPARSRARSLAGGAAARRRRADRGRPRRDACRHRRAARPGTADRPRRLHPRRRARPRRRRAAACTPRARRRLPAAPGRPRGAAGRRVAAAIAARAAAASEPAPFRPVLRGRLLTSGAPLYLQARPSGQSLASHHALWSPPEKVAGRYLAPYLATARPVAARRRAARRARAGVGRPRRRRIDAR